MKKLSIADVKASEILSKDERKMVVGGSSDDIGGRECYPSTCSIEDPNNDYKIIYGYCTISCVCMSNGGILLGGNCIGK